MNKKILSKMTNHLKSEFYDINNDYLNLYSEEKRYSFSSNGRMKKAKRNSFAWVVKNTINEIKNNIEQYTEGNPTMYYDDIDLYLNGEMIDKCFKKYCDKSFEITNS